MGLLFPLSRSFRRPYYLLKAHLQRPTQAHGPKALNPRVGGGQRAASEVAERGGSEGRTSRNEGRSKANVRSS
jgi:hypothetical protein